jgi:SAM-dependent methyltransferase
MGQAASRTERRDTSCGASEPVWAAAEERYAYVRTLLLRTSPPPADLIELGAAPGAQCLALSRLGYRVTGVDLGAAPDAWGDDPARSTAATFERARIKLVVWNLDEPPYPLDDASFDVTLMTEVLEHLRDYPLRALRQVRRILRPGGILVLTTPNAASLQNRFRLMAGRSVSTPLPDWMYGLPHARHAREYTARELRELVAEAGFEVVTLDGRHFHIRSGRQKPLSVLVKRALDRVARVRPTLGAGLAVVARRPAD